MNRNIHNPILNVFMFLLQNVSFSKVKSDKGLVQLLLGQWEQREGEAPDWRHPQGKSQGRAKAQSQTNHENPGLLGIYRHLEESSAMATGHRRGICGNFS